MTRVNLERRLKALEAATDSLKTIEGWAAVYGWHQINEWEARFAAHVRQKLLGDDAPFLEETALERNFHEAMIRAYTPDKDEVDRARIKILGER